MLGIEWQWGRVMSMPSWKTKKIGATGADEAASYPGQVHSVSRFGCRYLCCPCIKHPDTNLKFAWTLWDPSLYPPKEYWYSLVGSFLCWCEVITWEAQPAVSNPSSHLTHLQRSVAFFAATCQTLNKMQTQLCCGLLSSLLGCDVLLKISSKSWKKFIKSLLVLRDIPRDRLAPSMWSPLRAGLGWTLSALVVLVVPTVCSASLGKLILVSIPVTCRSYCKSLLVGSRAQGAVLLGCCRK